MVGVSRSGRFLFLYLSGNVKTSGNANVREDVVLLDRVPTAGAEDGQTW